MIRLQETTENTDRVLDESLNADILVWIHTHGVENRGNVSMESVLRRLRESRIPSVAYHLDLYMGIPDRWFSYKNSEYMKVDHFFTVDPKMADYFNTQTATRGHYLPAGVYAPECYMATPSEISSAPLAFVGSMRYHKDWPYRPKLINWLMENYPAQFRLYGQDGGKVVRGHELNQTYADTKVVVGDTFSPGFDYPGYWSDRATETVGRGGFIIHPRISGMEEIFEDRKHLVFYDFNDFDQLKSLIDYYLVNDEEREEIRRVGHEHVKKNHTYTNRWNTILTTVF